MIPKVYGYYRGYLGKVAQNVSYSDDALPRKTMWNLFPGHALEEAGRGKALFEAQKKKPPFSVKHPYLNYLGGALGGAALGAAAGAGTATALTSPEDVKKVQASEFLRRSSWAGGIAGAVAGAALAVRNSLKRTHMEAEYLENIGITPEISEEAQRLLKEKAEKSGLLHTLAGAVVGHIMHGRTSQLRALTGDSRVDGSRLLTVAGHVPGVNWGMNLTQGMLSVLQARKSGLFGQSSPLYGSVK